MTKEVVFLSIPKDDFKILMIDSLNACIRANKLIQFKEKDKEEPEDQEELLTKKEAAKLLKVSVSTIANYGRSGILKKYYIGRAVRFKRSDVLALASPTKKG